MIFPFPGLLRLRECERRHPGPTRATEKLSQRGGEAEMRHSRRLDMRRRLEARDRLRGTGLIAALAIRYL